MTEATPFAISIAASGLGHVTRGIEAWAVDVAHSLRERGIPVGLFRGSGDAPHELDQVVGCLRRDSFVSKTLVSTVPKRLRWRFGYGSPYSIEQTSFATRLIRQLNERRVQLLHVQDPLVARSVQQAFDLGKCPTRVILGHGTEEPLEFLRQIRFVQHLAPWHLEQSLPITKDSSFPSHDARGTNWTAIPNFVDVDQFRPGRAVDLRDRLGIPRDAFVILCAAAIKRTHKRIDYLIDEFAQLLKLRPGRNIYLVIAGASEPDTPSLIQRGKRELGDQVRFLVATPREEMPALFRMADLFSLTSLYEMMPIALLEAIASGLPCLIHTHDVLRWMAGAGGVSTDLNLPGGWAAAAESLIDDESRRGQLSSAARIHCLQNFAKDPVVDQLCAYYSQILGSTTNRSAA